MRSALLASGTVHAVLTASGSVPGKETFSTEVIADVSFAAGALHTSTSSVRDNLIRHTEGLERSELKVADGRGAWRVPHMSWQCQNLLPSDVSGDLLAIQAQPASARFAGTGTVGGVAVRTVTAEAIIIPWTGPKDQDTVEFDIARDTDLPVRVRTTFDTHWGRARATETLVERYSNFGAPLHITLPKKCR